MSLRHCFKEFLTEVFFLGGFQVRDKRVLFYELARVVCSSRIFFRQLDSIRPG